MIQCSMGHGSAEVIEEPKWWPKELKFSNPVQKPKKSNEVSPLILFQNFLFTLYFICMVNTLLIQSY